MNDFDDWAKELGDFFEDAARTTERWAEQTIHSAIETADNFADELEKQIRPSLERWASEIHQSVEPIEAALDSEAERFADEFTEFITPVVVPLAGAVESWLEVIAAPITSHVDPVVNEHTPCIGCKHYHGQSHGGHMLVCGMYPYGPEDTTCPDWESVWGQPPSNG